MKIKAFSAPTLTSAVADRLTATLGNRPGVDALKINPDTQELYIAFNEQLLDLPTLIGLMADAGCPLRTINAVFFK
jgi:hypothetical protein